MKNCKRKTCSLNTKEANLRELITSHSAENVALTTQQRECIGKTLHTLYITAVGECVDVAQNVGATNFSFK